MKGPYDSIIQLPHHTSKKHPRMSIEERAAQFAPFAALSGYGAAIDETARYTEREVELDEYEKASLNERLADISARVKSRPVARFTYFVPDKKKAGGAYRDVEGAVIRVDGFEKCVILADGTRIPFDAITAVYETGRTHGDGGSY